MGPDPVFGKQWARLWLYAAPHGQNLDRARWTRSVFTSNSSCGKWTCRAFRLEVVHGPQDFLLKLPTANPTIIVSSSSSSSSSYISIIFIIVLFLYIINESWVFYCLKFKSQVYVYCGWFNDSDVMTSRQWVANHWSCSALSNSPVSGSLSAVLFRAVLFPSWRSSFTHSWIYNYHPIPGR